MIKKILIVALFSTNLIAEEYKVKLSDENVSSIIIKDYVKNDSQNQESPYQAGEFISVDYLTNNDSRVTLDTDTGLEWLDLDYTGGMVYETVLSELGSGGLYEGWRVPTTLEIEALMGKMFPIAKNEGTLYAGNAWKNSSTEESQNFRSLMAETRLGSAYQYGLHKLSNGQYSVTGSYFSGLFAPLNFGGTSSSHGDAGIFLVSDGGLTLSSKNNPAINTPAN